MSDRVIVPMYIPVSQTLDIKIGFLSPGGVSWSVPASLRALDVLLPEVWVQLADQSYLLPLLCAGPSCPL